MLHDGDREDEQHSDDRSPDKSQNVEQKLDTACKTFDYAAFIADPFREQSQRDDAFQRKLRSALLAASINAHTWAVARTVHERTTTEETIEKRIDSLLEVQREQGRSSHPVSLMSFFECTRDRLRALFEVINSAVANIAGISI
ncbi:hypothetical protein SERLA73DRAFT_79253 [Serpula lacrymans var. lacrymans S7.3]|uniref:Uncharacterized protein n=2 Tax=Serpula lacrymans var. lacrymans TaxID=341189 RepID=F8QFR9_SERL3|nr:uncharacterized protein SERLADRAFT_433699 [Serpula lacrymans var. lacrymans S7.9]EGN92903.1 hypothetical protein SERLA73DRAFT_79253 [Serpula lacrymans var. lacrymans S7.3]EGO29733.1 hypothetical protein SERLADRAFT_433699 [Serpula lacrymans var. lacrymans S7.9]